MVTFGHQYKISLFCNSSLV
jgi:hypothetical protein